MQIHISYCYTLYSTFPVTLHFSEHEQYLLVPRLEGLQLAAIYLLYDYGQCMVNRTIVCILYYCTSIIVYFCTFASRFVVRNPCRNEARKYSLPILTIALYALPTFNCIFTTTTDNVLFNSTCVYKPRIMMYYSFIKSK